MHVDHSVVARWTSMIFAGQSISGIEPFTDGVTNYTCKVTFGSRRQPVVLRLYRDPAKLQNEVSALRIVREVAPVAALLHVQPVPVREMPPFIVLEYIDGVTFRQFRRGAGAALVREVAHQIGRTLAAIHAIQSAPADDFAATQMAWAKSIPSSPLLRRRLGAERMDRVRSLIESRQHELETSTAAHCLTHGDFNNRNVLVRCTDGRWQVAGVVDWECARLATPLCDVARFLQYESLTSPSREPGFSNGYRDGGGHLPEDWWFTTRAINLVDQCQLLSEEEVPDHIVEEVVGLVRTTLAEYASR